METAIGEFLDHFYSLSVDARPASIAEEPAVGDDPQKNALIAAIAEHLAKNHTSHAPPAWVEAEERFLPMPWFTAKDADAGLCEYLTCYSPAAFKRRNIMTDGAPLRRARVPASSIPSLDASSS